MVHSLSQRHGAIRAAFALAALILLAVALPDESRAKTPIYAFDVNPSTTQAGAHPDLLTTMNIGVVVLEPPNPCECNNPKELIVNTPPGLIGTPSDIPQCAPGDFSQNDCPIDSQIGIIVLNEYWGPVYNLTTRPGELALLGSVVFGQPIVYTEITARTESDYGLELRTLGLPPEFAAPEINLVLWGVPASPIHDLLRFPLDALKGNFCQISGDGDPLPEILANEFPVDDCGGWFGLLPNNESSPPSPLPANTPPVPFLQNPTACGGALTPTFETVAYDRETDFAEGSFLPLVGCEQLNFNPSLVAKPTTTAADSPSGLDIDLTVPQTLSPNTPTPSAIRDLTVVLPEGIAINPNAADGKTSCTDGQARFGTREPALCPEQSKIGTLSVTSSSFPAELPGAMYLGEPLPGSRYRVFLVADGFSLHVKLPGTVRLDPDTGQLTVIFRDLPQFTFQEFNLHLFGAERGVLATPTHCGSYAVKSTFTPWSNPALPEQTSTQFFTVDSGPDGSPCPPAERPFGPRFAAGVTDGTAGGHTALSVQVERPDGDQALQGIEVRTPPGIAASLKGIPYCPEGTIAALQSSSYTGLAELAAPSCPSASLVGTVRAGAGAGTRPLFVPGRAYLAGPYKGAPLSFLVVVPAVSGPYDLGNVVVRVALRVDPVTARVTAVSDPLPRILEGIPLRTRSIRIDLDRPDFVLNPTNCDPFAIEADVFGDQGATARLSSHFQVANCANLPYEPGLKLELSGGVRRRGHPAIHAVLTAKPGEANSRRISVTLPDGELLDNAHIGTVCTRVDFARDACPAKARIGRVEVSSPILDQPLRGSVYLRSSAHDLPDIALDLEGQFDIEAAARVDSVKGRLRTTFESIADVPLSRVEFDLLGGSKGLIQNSETLCGAGKKASARMVGQNGRRADFKVALRPDCSKSRGKGRGGR
jgi:hypothetical protein